MQQRPIACAARQLLRSEDVESSFSSDVSGHTDDRLLRASRCTDTYPVGSYLALVDRAPEFSGSLSFLCRDTQERLMVRRELLTALGV